jgi:hypothetical protein
MHLELRIPFIVSEEERRMLVFATHVAELPPVGFEVALKDPRFPRFPIEDHGTTTEDEVGYAQAFLGMPDLVAQFGGPDGLCEAMEAEGFELVGDHIVPLEQ